MNRVLKSKDAIITQNYSSNHQAIDLVGENYTLDYITAHSDGVVELIQSGKKNNRGSTGNKSYGNFIKIKHNNDYHTLYAHMEYLTVKNGQIVKAGDIIGYMGDSGNATGNHLHFEIWKGSKRINPMQYLNKNLPSSISYYPKYTGNSNSIVDAFKNLSINSSFTFRKKIAIANDITNYSGTANQNMKLLTLLKEGNLRKV